MVPHVIPSEIHGANRYLERGVPFEKLGMPTLPEKSYASVSEGLQHTLYGGLKAVVYTDVIQCIVMVGGCLFVLFYGIHRLGGLREFVDLVEYLGHGTSRGVS